MSAWVFLIPPVLVVTWGVLTYNTMVRLRQMVDESWSGIDTELKRRYDLIPNLVDVVKGYAAHESSTFEAVVRARDRAAASGGTPARRRRAARMDCFRGRNGTSALGLTTRGQRIWPFSSFTSWNRTGWA